LDSNTSIDDGSLGGIPPRPPFRPDSANYQAGFPIHKLEQWLGVLEIFLHVTVIIFAVIELGPKFVPQPTLVWAQEVTEAAGFQTVNIRLWNSANVPLEQIEARWTIPNPNVKIYVQSTAPQNVIESPSPSHWVLRFTSAIPAGDTIMVFLHADEPFQIASQEFKAFVPKISHSQAFVEPAEVETSEEWSKSRRESYFTLAYWIAIFLGFAFVIHKAIAKSKEVIERKEAS
jgi:hypothetical protein